MTMSAQSAALGMALGLACLSPATGAAQSDDGTPYPLVSGYAYMAPSTQGLQDDDFINPGHFAIAAGQRLWVRPQGPNGTACAECHGTDPSAMAGVATRYPRVDAASGQLENLEGRINRCLTDNIMSDPYPYESDDLLALTAYISNASRGLPMNVAIDNAAQPLFDQGRDLYFQRRGQLDLACNQCHNDRAGERLRGDVISQGHVNGFPIYRLKWSAMGSRHRMFQWCNTSLRAEPFALGSPEYLALELYVAWRGNGLPIETPAVRR